MSAKVMRFLLVTMGVLIAVACTIPYLALTDGYQRTMASPAKRGEVIAVKGEKVIYKIFHAKARRGWHRAGWSRPRRSLDIPAVERAKLKPGSALVVRRGLPELAASPPSPLLLFGAAAGLLFAIWAFVAPILERRGLDAIRDDSLAIVRFMLRKTRNSQLIIVLLALFAAAFFIVVGLFAEDGGMAGRVTLFVFAGICALAAAAVARVAWRLRDPSKAPLMHTLEHDPARIVWVYVNQVIVHGISSYNIFVCCHDGERYELNLRQLDPELAMAALKDRLPQTTFGFSEALEKRYRRSPQSFANASLATG